MHDHRQCHRCNLELSPGAMTCSFCGAGSDMSSWKPAAPDHIPPPEMQSDLTEAAWRPVVRGMVVILIAALSLTAPAGIYSLWLGSIQGTIGFGFSSFCLAVALWYFRSRSTNKVARFLNAICVRPGDSVAQKRLSDIYVAAAAVSLAASMAWVVRYYPN